MRRAVYLVAILALVGCRNRQESEIVKESYFHKYGVPIAKSEWESQGEEGKVIQVRSDGVTTSKNYINGVLNGETTYTFPNSSIVQWVEIYQDGELVTKRENYASGVAMQEEVLQGNDLVKQTKWYEDGTPELIETYHNHLVVAGEYRNPLNIVESRVDEGQGIRMMRASSGELVSKDTIRNGEMIESIVYFSNGDPQTVTPYENGIVHGTRLTYLQGGLPNTVEQWVRGDQDGVTLAFQNGEKIAEIPYAHGKKNGTELRYKDGSMLAEEVVWQDDMMHGAHNIYVDGETRTEWYHQGELVNRTTFEKLNIR